MRHLRAWIHRAIGTFASTRRERDLHDELASHLQLHIDDNLRAGMTPDAARRQAMLKLGGVEPVKERVRDRRGLPWLDSLRQDVRYGIRFLRRSPGFTAVAILSLALGIGANTAIFSLLDSLLLRSLPVRQADRLVQIAPGHERRDWTNPLWEQIRDRSDVFAGAGAWSDSRFNLSDGGEARYVNGMFASGGLFRVLGVMPVLGRGIQKADDRPGGGPDGPVAVISYRFWQTQFAGARDVLGRTLTLSGAPFTIVGVSPPGFNGLVAGSRFDVVVPVGASPVLMRRDGVLQQRSFWWLRIIARLKPGQTLASASAALRAVQPAIREATLPGNYRPNERARYLKEPFVLASAARGADSLLRDQYRRPLLTLMAVVGLILFVACVNLANLLLARADTRRHELSVRLALGASRARLMWQLLVESLLLAGGGAALGALFATWGGRLIVSQLPATSGAVYFNLSPDWRVLAFTGVTLVVVALLFGTAPALRATGGQPTDALAERSHQVRAPVRWRLSGSLMVVQMGLCLVLVFGAGLFVRTFASLATRPLGFTPGPVLVASLERPRTDEPSTIPVEALVEAIRLVPGVRSAAASSLVPLGRMQWDETLENPDGLSLPESDRDVWMNAVSPGWFGTLETTFVSGRDFGRQDSASAPPVAIVNQAFAQRYFPGRGVLGESVRFIGAARRAAAAAEDRRHRAQRGVRLAAPARASHAVPAARAGRPGGGRADAGHPGLRR